MRAKRLIISAMRRIEVESFELGPLPDDGILVEHQYTAVSAGTEIYGWAHGGEPGRKVHFPHPTGYCSFGTVLAVGKEVAHIRPGDRVAGEGNHASHAIFSGADGRWQQVPEAVPSPAATFMVMGAIALHGIRVARIELGEGVVVLGLGMVGQLAAKLAQCSGALPVIAVDVDDFRLEKARLRGVDICLNGEHTDDLRGVVRGHYSEDGANVVVEATGIPAVYPTAVGLACTGGRVVALGSPRGTVAMDFFADAHLREVSIVGAHQPKTPESGHLYYRWNKDRERRLVLRLMAEGKLAVEDLITHVAEPDQCQDIYAMLAEAPRQVLGVMFAWR